MKNLLRTLYGNVEIKSKRDYIIAPGKVLYIIFSIPFLIFAFSLYGRGGGGFGSPSDEKIGPLKKILVHIACVFWSCVLWSLIINALLGNLETV